MNNTYRSELPEMPDFYDNWKTNPEYWGRKHGLLVTTYSNPDPDVESEMRRFFSENKPPVL